MKSTTALFLSFNGFPFTNWIFEWYSTLCFGCRHSPYLSALDFRILDFGVYFKLGKKSSSKPTWFFFEFELDFYCLCSLQKSISKSNWFFSFLNLIFWNWKKFEWHSISQKSSGDRQGVCKDFIAQGRRWLQKKVGVGWIKKPAKTTLTLIVDQ